ncbi:hypothetical protein [Ornithinibacillus bavariensis]|uniref:Uncharacterized protein n=1 Tax=Ornithinibacillus bavariensis TaxID=545502 RepID=A0A919XAR7_9BACI|nr:hypothetical protein [Ornithinibacillus bavariensis]GIO27983.1 hypothetical protein J43TS3_25940 [Ornithinibacillus bavariensis]
MKKNIIIKLLSVLVIVLVFTSSHFYKEAKRMKVEVGYDYLLLIQDTRYSVRDMLSIMQEALQTEHGLDLIGSFRIETINKQSQFDHFRLPISEVGEMYFEVY